MRLRHFLLAGAAAAAFAGPASAGQNAMIGEIQLFAFGFCPVDYAEANGAALQITQNAALYSLFGTNFGGNGQTTFHLPDLRGRVAVGDDLSYAIGQYGGLETTVLPGLPRHGHRLVGSLGDPAQGTPSGSALPDKTFAGNTDPIYSGSAIDPTNPGPTVQMSPAILSTEGGGQPYSQFQPSLSLRYCVRVQGDYPSRN